MWIHWLLLIFLHFVTHDALSVSLSPFKVNFNDCTTHDLRYLQQQSFVREIIAEHCNIEELESAIFLRYRALATLEITDSKLATLQGDALNGLDGLRVLSLSRNNISEVKAWSSDPLQKLTSLDLHRNAIRVLSASSFARYPLLRRLNLAHNLLADIADDVFQWTPQLRYLNLGRNHLKIIGAHHFRGVRWLRHLLLYHNQISQIERMSLENHGHLRALRLEGNELDDLSFISAMKVTRLVHLNLSHNSIESVDRLTFSKSDELRDLDLSHNRMRDISGDTFTGLKSLKVLNLSHNAILHIDPTGFHQLTHLAYIDLSVNNLILLPDDLFHANTQLQHINLSTNALQNISTHLFAELPHLAEVDLSTNALEAANFLYNSFSETKRTKLQLNLIENRLRELNISALVDFKSVELADNAFSCRWLMQQMRNRSANIHFGRQYRIPDEMYRNNSSSLDVIGVNCYDEVRNRSIMLISVGGEYKTACEPSQVVPSAPLLIWPRIHLGKFDSRSVIIWLLIACAIVFSGLRLIRRKFEQQNTRSHFEKKWLESKEIREVRNVRNDGKNPKNMDTLLDVMRS